VNAFSGGIFVAAALIHLIPEATLLYHGSNLVNEPYPMTYLIMTISYCFILMVEKIFFNPHELFKHEHDDEHSHPNNELDGLKSNKV